MTTTRRVRAGQPVSEGADSAKRINELIDIQESQRAFMESVEENIGWTLREWLIALIIGAAVLFAALSLILSIK